MIETSLADPDVILGFNEEFREKHKKFFGRFFYKGPMPFWRERDQSNQEEILRVFAMETRHPILKGSNGDEV